MSNERVVSSLKGFDKQLFPPLLHMLSEIYERNYIDKQMLEEIGLKIPGFGGWDIPTTVDEGTGDEYKWFCAMYFRTGGGETATLFPRANDRARKDGMSLDRSIAVYTKGRVHIEEVNEVMINVYKEFYELEKMQAGGWAESKEFPELPKIPGLGGACYIIN